MLLYFDALDTNSGETIDQAKLTFGSAITAAGTPANEAAAVSIVDIRQSATRHAIHHGKRQCRARLAGAAARLRKR